MNRPFNREEKKRAASEKKEATKKKKAAAANLQAIVPVLSHEEIQALIAKVCPPKV